MPFKLIKNEVLTPFYLSPLTRSGGVTICIESLHNGFTSPQTFKTAGEAILIMWTKTPDNSTIAMHIFNDNVQELELLNHYGLSKNTIVHKFDNTKLPDPVTPMAVRAAFEVEKKNTMANEKRWKEYTLQWKYGFVPHYLNC